MRHEEFKFSPQTPVASTQGMFGQWFGNSDMNRFSAAITTGFENAQSSRNVDMQRYNPSTQQGTPLEVIQRYKTKLSQENFYTSTKIALFNNKLTDDGASNQQDQRFVLSPKNSNTLLIYTDGSLFQNLGKYNSNGKDCTALIAQAPKLKGWDAHSWYI